MWRILVTSLVLATLLITDGTTIVNLLDPKTGFCLANYAPASAAFKGGGVWRDSSLAEGRRLADKKFGNINETFTLDLTHHSQDTFARSIQNLERLLLKAADYWTEDAQNEPVWIEAQSACETNKRYALLHTGQLSDLPDPFGQPVWGIEGQSSASSLLLGFERSFWLENEPGTGTCVQISGKQDYYYTTATTWSGSPTASEDDCYTFVDDPTFSLAGTSLAFGNYLLGPTAAGIRFPGVNVPANATIIDAYIEFEAHLNGPNDDFKTVIQYEVTANGASFSDRADFFSSFRTRSDTAIRWYYERGWTAGNTYTTPAITPLIQEVVDLPGWTANNAIVLFITDDGSDTDASRVAASWDNVTRAAPVLYITYQTADMTTFGRAATCNNEVYFANKHNMANITDAYWYDASLTSFSPSNLIGLATPFNLLPNPVQDGDIIYLCSNTAVENSGPFCSAVFDVGTAAVYDGDAIMNWYYWNGAQTTLPIRDNTDDLGEGNVNVYTFSASDVNSLHWEQPSDWTTTTINGITGYWVWGIVSITSGSMTTPTQQNRDIYSIVWPYTDIAAAQIGGDVKALGRIKVHGQSNSRDNSVTIEPTLWISKVLIGSRKVSRGEDFTAYINLSDEQNADGILVELGSSVVSFATDTTAPSGRALLINPASNFVLTSLVRVYIGAGDDTLASQFYGTYRVFMRYYQSSGADADYSAQLRFLTSPSSHPISTDELNTEGQTRFNFFDFGKVTITPPGTPTSTDLGEFVAIDIYLSCSDHTVDLYLYDIVLLPVDELVVVAEDSNQVLVSYNPLTPNKYLDLDSIGQPKSARALARRSGTDAILGEYSLDTDVLLPNNLQQRFWMFAQRYISVGEPGDYVADPYLACSMQIERNNRYKFMRGDR